MPESALPSSTSPRLLVLWDIDHTLIETRGVGRKLFERAFLDVTGKPLTNRADISGRTELDIMRESLKVNDVEATDATVGQLMDALTQGYEAARGELGEVGRALPGALETVAALAAEPEVFQTVLTGNLRAVALIKLEVFGLAEQLNLDLGAYGDDAHERAELVKIAQQRAHERLGVDFTGQRTVLIGDTPNDIAAGKANGARTVGVATGKTSVEELYAGGAEVVVPELENSQLRDKMIL